MQKKIDISIVIPLYNEEKSLPELHERLVRILGSLKETWEIIFIDDGSRDSSPDLLRSFFQKDKKTKVLILSHNYGQQAALMAGFEHSKGNVVITMDADLQNKPEEIPEFLKAISEGHDIVCGRRTRRKDPFFSRKFPSFLAKWVVSRYTGVPLHDYGCGFRAFTRDCVKYILDFGEAGKDILLLGLKEAKKVKEIDVSHSGRKYGESRYNFKSLINLTMDIVTGYSTMPFKLVGILGVLLFLVGSVISIYYLSVRFLFFIIPEIGPRIMLLTLIFLFMGLQLIILGFLGEYVLRLNQRLQKKPMYKIDFYLT